MKGMKKFTTLFWVVLIGVSVFSCATGGETTAGKPAPETEKPAVQDGALTVDKALGDFMAYIAGRLPADSLTAVALMDAPAQRLGNYLTDELISRLLNDAGVRVVSRQDFERILAEQDVQADLNFDDDTTAKIGHNLGWGTIVFGTVNPLQDAYHLSLRAVDVETGELRGTKSYVLQSDATLASLVNPNVTVQQLTERESLLQPFDGKRNNFELRIWPSSQKNVYYDNDELFINLLANEDCYFVVYQVDIDNNMQVIYPNFWETGKNVLKAGVTRTIPEDTSFVLHAPYGEERILVYASQRPFTIPKDQYNPQPISKERLASPQALWRIESGSGDGSKALSVVPRGATGQFSYTILPK
ncbi:MAG: DUF4384 domain-containing protein [Treponema sp.]|jgi:hypothetical protein|nr:DUF4384 domain-containing protein [Treponema sp.]